MSKKLLVIILSSVVVLLVAGFLVWKFAFVKSTPFDKSAKGLQVSPVISTETANKLIDQTGGEVDLSVNGTISKLILPAKSVSGSTSIEIKKISSISGLPGGMDLISGNELGPDGLWLDMQADLKISLTSEQLSKKLIGFSYSGSGADFRFYPMKIVGGEATFKLSGFSGYGVLELKEDKAAPAAPSTIERQAQQFIANIVREGQSQSGGISSDQTNRIKNILTAWYNTSLKGNLKEAETTPDKIDSALHEYKSWLTMVQLFGLDDSFKSEIEVSMNSLALSIKNASAKASKVCTDQKDPNQASKLLRYYKISELMGLDGRSNLKSSDIQDMTKKCVRFKLTITSKQISGGSIDKGSVEASGEGAIVLDDSMQLTGSGQITVSNYFMNTTMPVCHGNAPEVWPFTIPSFSLSQSGTNKLSLPFDLGTPNNVVYDCSTDLVTVTEPNSAWIFDLAHQDELQSSSETVGNYLLKDWEIVGKGEVFARKVYNRTVTPSQGMGMLTIQEQTTFELIHQPQK